MNRADFFLTLIKSGTLSLTCFSFATLALSGCSSKSNVAPVSETTRSITGAAIGDNKDTTDARVKEQEEFINRQQAELLKQERELEDLKRQKYHNDYFKSRYPSAAE